MKEIPLQMVHLVPFPTPLPLLNSVTKASVTLQHLIQTRIIPLAVRGKKRPHRGVMVDTAAKDKKDLGVFYLRNASINPADIVPKDMPEKLCAISLAREKNATTLIVTLLSAIPGRLLSSNARGSMQLPIISSKKMWFGSTNTIS
jgi:hypothetical protein